MMNTPVMNQSVSVVGLFDTSNEAQNAIQELVSRGVTREEISLVSNHAQGAGSRAAGETPAESSRIDTNTVDGTSVGENVAAGTLFGGLGGLLIGLGALAIPGIGPVVAAGPIAAALAGAGFGALGGGVIAGLKQVGVPEGEADVYAEAVRRGGTIVTVTTNHASADDVADILNRNGAVDVDDRGNSYRQTGWSRFDENAGPYVRDNDLETTRSTYSPDVRNTRIYPQQGQSVTDHDSAFREDYDKRYANTPNASYEDYRPAYEYGHRMAKNDNYVNRRFDEVEPELQRDYEAQYPHKPWSNFKAAVQQGWDKMTGQR